MQDISNAIQGLGDALDAAIAAVQIMLAIMGFILMLASTAVLWLLVHLWRDLEASDQADAGDQAGHDDTHTPGEAA